MSDEERQQAQRVQVAQAEAQPAETTGERWGDPISAERQAELQGYLDRWEAETDHGTRKGPFDGVRLSDLRLTGADVSWLAEQSGRDQYGQVPNLHLETLYVNTL